MVKKVISKIFFGVILAGYLQSCHDNTAVMTSMSSIVNGQPPATYKKIELKDDLKTRLAAATMDLRKLKIDDENDLPDTPNEMIEMADCKNENTLLSEAIGNPDRQIQHLTEQLKKEIEIFQLVNFPKIRRHFQLYLKNIDSLIDIDVQLGGARNTVLTFIGGPYAPNENMQPAMDLINDQVNALRFKAVNFKWAPHDAHCTTYRIDSPEDDVVL
jgi:hypothetical protein